MDRGLLGEPSINRISPELTLVIIESILRSDVLIAFTWFVDRMFTVSDISTASALNITRPEGDVLAGLRSFTVLIRSEGDVLTGLRSFTGVDMFECRLTGIMIEERRY